MAEMVGSCVFGQGWLVGPTIIAFTDIAVIFYFLQHLDFQLVMWDSVLYICMYWSLQFDPQRSLFGELKFSEKKGFKKFGFDFTQFRLSYYKDVARVSGTLC